MAEPDWSQRMPGEQWVVLDSIEAAEAYLLTYQADAVTIQREPYPNASGLYARIARHGQVLPHRIYVSELNG